MLFCHRSTYPAAPPSNGLRQVVIYGIGQHALRSQPVRPNASAVIPCSASTTRQDKPPDCALLIDGYPPAVPSPLGAFDPGPRVRGIPQSRPYRLHVLPYFRRRHADTKKAHPSDWVSKPCECKLSSAGWTRKAQGAVAPLAFRMPDIYIACHQAFATSLKALANVLRGGRLALDVEFKPLGTAPGGFFVGFDSSIATCIKRVEKHPTPCP